MKVRLTFDLNDLDRRAIAMASKCKRPAGRNQAVQFITQTIHEAIEVHRREVRLRDANPDPEQQKFPGNGGRLMAELSTVPRSISHAQRQRLFGIAKRRGMSTDELRAATRDGSIAALSRADASTLITELGGEPLANPPGQAPPLKKRRAAEGCVRMITTEHVGQIARLLDDYFGRGMPTRGYDWLRKNFKVQSIRELGTAQRGGQVIRVLKGMIERREAPVGEVTQQR